MGLNIGSLSNMGSGLASGIGSGIGSVKGASGLGSSALSSLGAFGSDKTSVSSDMAEGYSSNGLASAVGGNFGKNTSGFMNFLSGALGSMGFDCSSADSAFGRISNYSQMFGAMDSVLGSMMESDMEELLAMLQDISENGGSSGIGGFGSGGSGNHAVASPSSSKASSSAPAGSASDALASGKKAGTAKGTGYYPDSSAMEGGYVDMRGAKLHTLQDYLKGDADYVSIALDKNLYKNGTIKYGDSFRIPELEEKYGKKIIFKAVDTGGAFTNKGFSRVDICTANRSASCDSTVNGNLTLVKC